MRIHLLILAIPLLLLSCNFESDQERFSNNTTGKGEYKNGLKEGHWTFYYENENIESKGHFKKDLLEGDTYFE